MTMMGIRRFVRLLKSVMARPKSHGDVVIVLGMHRSGTSCLTGLLEQAGLALGPVVRNAPYNRKGNLENRDILALNNAILAHSGGAWDSPPSRLRWMNRHERFRDSIITASSHQKVWGFKDPRTLITLLFWLEALEKEKVHFVGTFRHPLSVARSLKARQSDMPISRGVALWRQYNERLLAYHQRFKFPILNFDHDPALFVNSAIAAIRGLRIASLRVDRPLDFFDDSLVHQNKLDERFAWENESLMATVRDVHEKLKALT